MTLETKIKALKDAYAALNRNDIDVFTALFDPQIVRIEFLGTPDAGVYQGIEAVRQHVAAGRSNWAEGGCEPTELHAIGDKVVVLVDVRVRLKGRAEWNEGRVGDVYTFHNGKATEFRSFAKEHDALRYAGVANSDGDRLIDPR